MDDLLNKVPTGLYIDGQWIKDTGRETINVLNPSTGKVLTNVANAGAEHASQAVDAAHRAAGNWASTSPRERSDLLRRCYDLMMEQHEDLAQLISLENGKALSDARGEVTYAAEFFRWFSEEAVRIRGDIGSAPSGNNQIIVQYQPIGISLLVTPWNFPAAMATRKIAPALAAGCTCILKPATATPLTAFLIAQIVEQAGIPAGVVNVLTTAKASDVTDTILADPRVRKLSFTGSTAVGRLLLKKAADQVISCSMELGGNAPFIVFEDANLEEAVEGAMLAKMRNGGEACTAANRIYVHRSIEDEFADLLTKRMAALEVGEGNSSSTECGPVVDQAALDKVLQLVDDAVAKGAKVATGGKALQREGFYVAPTVLKNVPDSADLVNEEIFGPVAPLIAFDSEEEVMARANETEYGLIAYVYTQDLSRGMRVAEKIESGMVALNRGLASDPAAPFGGMKQSGLGREGSYHGIREFMEVKYIATQWG